MHHFKSGFKPSNVSTLILNSVLIIYIKCSLNMDHYIEEVDGHIFKGLQAPSNCWISGVTGSGKTSLVHRMLVHKDELYSQPRT